MCAFLTKGARRTTATARCAFALPMAADHRGEAARVCFSRDLQSRATRVSRASGGFLREYCTARIASSREICCDAHTNTQQ